MSAHETSSTAGLRLLLVDDHAMFRAGVCTLIERDLQVSEVLDCDTGEQAMLAIEQDAPDIALLDIALRGEDGIELARRIHAQTQGRVSCIMLSMHQSAEYVIRAFAAGARGYVVKDAGPAELINAIETVAAGQRYVSASASGALVAGMHLGETAPPHHALSPRQLQVLCLVAQGMSTKLIARELDLSTKTVDSHRYQICQRLQVHDVAGMVLYAIRNGLVEPQL